MAPHLPVLFGRQECSAVTARLDASLLESDTGGILFMMRP